MKYLIVRDRAEQDHAIIFPDAVAHNMVGRIHRASDIRVVSAGFCDWQSASGRWTVSGYSETLDMRSRPEDADILLRSFPQQDMT